MGICPNYGGETNVIMGGNHRYCTCHTHESSLDVCPFCYETVHGEEDMALHLDTCEMHVLACEGSEEMMQRYHNTTMAVSVTTDDYNVIVEATYNGEILSRETMTAGQAEQLAESLIHAAKVARHMDTQQ